MMKAFSLLPTIPLLFLAASAWAQAIKPDLQASRLSGPAPLAVLFDASGTTDPGTEFPFHQLRYDFQFGDAKAGKWAVSGLDKNEQSGGPLAAHVFDTPGVYTVKLVVRRPNGTPAQTSLQVEVLDPARVFAGRDTICVSTSGDFTGAPAGAAQVRELPESLTGKRVLLRRGESFGAIRPQGEDRDFQVGAFGTGPKPKVEGVQTGKPGPRGENPTDWTVMDLDIGAGTVNVEFSTRRFLLYRNDIRQHTDSVAMINIATAVTYYRPRGFPDIPWPREVFLVENDVLGRISQERGASPNLVAMGFFYHSALLGNTMDRAYEHTLRIWAAGKTVIAHNALGGNHRPEADGIGIRAALKLHSGGTQPWTDLVSSSPAPMTDQVILANNVLGSPTYPGSWLSGFSPQNNGPETVEGLQDCIAENNHYIRGPESDSYKSELQLRGRRLTARGNTREGGKPDIVRSGFKYAPGLDDWDGPYFISR
jgi:hypothetical protein